MDPTSLRRPRRRITPSSWRGFLLACFLTPIALGASLVAPPLAEVASATSICYQHYYYSGYITTNYANRGISGDILYNKDDMYLYDDSTDHAALYLNNSSQPDSSVSYDHFGWLQAGYFVGSAALSVRLA